MIEDSDDRKAVAEIAALKQEVAHASSTEAAERAASELLWKSLEHGSGNPDPICARIEAELERDPMQYRCLLDVWDGNTRGAAAMVRDHMIALGKLGKQWSMHRAMAHAESLAARVVMR